MLATPNPGHIWRSYYYAGGQRVAVRVQDRPDPRQDGLFYLLGDHLDSTRITTDEDGNQIAEMRYSAWGEVRYSSGGTPTKYTYTGKYYT